MGLFFYWVDQNAKETNERQKNEHIYNATLLCSFVSFAVLTLMNSDNNFYSGRFESTSASFFVQKKTVKFIQTKSNYEEGDLQ